MNSLLYFPQLSTTDFFKIPKKRIVCFRNNIEKSKYDFAKKMRKNPTKSEEFLWNYLRCKKTGFKFRRQSQILGYIVDFYCPVLQLVIEVDGGIHNYRKEYDKKRDFVMFKYGFTVIRLTDRDVLFKTDKLLSLLNTLKSGTRSQVTTIKKT